MSGFAESYTNELLKSLILALLPQKGDKTHIGKTRKEICSQINISPKRVSAYLQSLKRQGKVRCYKGRWRQV